MYKKIVSLVLALAVVMSVIVITPITASAQELPSGQCGDNVYRSLDIEIGVLDIIGSGKKWDYPNCTDVPWCSYKTVTTKK